MQSCKTDILCLFVHEMEIIGDMHLYKFGTPSRIYECITKYPVLLTYFRSSLTEVWLNFYFREHGSVTEIWLRSCHPLFTNNGVLESQHGTLASSREATTYWSCIEVNLNIHTILSNHSIEAILTVTILEPANHRIQQTKERNVH